MDSSAVVGIPTHNDIPVLGVEVLAGYHAKVMLAIIAIVHDVVGTKRHVFERDRKGVKIL